METKVKENKSANIAQPQAKDVKQEATKAAAFVNNNPVNQESVKPQPESAQPKQSVEPTKPTSAAPKAEQKKEAEQVKPEPAKSGLNLEGTLKLVEILHRRKIQRDRLLETIDTLEAFEVAQQEEGDETDSNHFQGCILVIEDDQKRRFTTKNPVIIQEVAQYVNFMCLNKLTEIEAGITLPA